ncbi:hypothetical protein MIR68_011579 [Amoeboaphelidium protococcarum]|nr:hypothetical protein MIR68_011579 [Amoeboaphelidium protococcarum]
MTELQEEVQAIDLVKNYLLENGYSLTFHSVNDVEDSSMDVDGLQSRQSNILISTLDVRKQFKSLIENGQIDQAIQQASQQYPEIVLSINQVKQMEKSSVDSQKKLDVTFNLYCLKFIEMVRQKQENEALRFAREVLVLFGNACQQFKEQLKSVVALLAYQNPLDSPVGYLLHQNHRELVASLLNYAILGKENQMTNLHVLAAHTTYLIRNNKVNGSTEDTKKWSIADFINQQSSTGDSDGDQMHFTFNQKQTKS